MLSRSGSRRLRIGRVAGIGLAWGRLARQGVRVVHVSLTPEHVRRWRRHAVVLRRLLLLLLLRLWIVEGSIGIVGCRWGIALRRWGRSLLRRWGRVAEVAGRRGTVAGCKDGRRGQVISVVEFCGHALVRHASGWHLGGHGVALLALLSGPVIVGPLENAPTGVDEPGEAISQVRSTLALPSLVNRGLPIRDLLG